jgi:hypothetical protein
MIQMLATFGPFSQETAIFLIASVVCFALAAFFGPVAGRFPGGPLGLIGLGLGLWVFPTMWNTAHVAFR